MGGGRGGSFAICLCEYAGRKQEVQVSVVSKPFWTCCRTVSGPKSVTFFRETQPLNSNIAGFGRFLEMEHTQWSVHCASVATNTQRCPAQGTLRKKSGRRILHVTASDSSCCSKSWSKHILAATGRISCVLRPGERVAYTCGI